MTGSSMTAIRTQKPRLSEMLETVAEALPRQSRSRRWRLLDLAVRMVWLRVKIEVLIIQVHLAGLRR